VSVDFEAIYAIDLVYVPGCWKLCGDAHCCSFARHKSRFRLLGARPAQELPLLPGEYEFLRGKGYLTQFPEHEHRAYEYAFEGGVIRTDTIVSRMDRCPCQHDIRPTVCRLYPLVPVYDAAGSVVSVHHGGVYEALERLEGLEPACRLEAIPFDELRKFLAVAALIGRDPSALFHISSYVIALRHLETRLAQLRAEGNAAGAFALFERNLLRSRLFDHALLSEELMALADAIELACGEPLTLVRALSVPHKVAG
jgi:hypothetical protein